MNPYVTLAKRTQDLEKRRRYAIIRGHQWRQLEKKKAAQQGTDQKERSH